MSQKNTDDEIPILEPKLFFGLSTGISGNAHFLSDTQLLHPAGKTLVIDDFTNREQTFIKIPPSTKDISIITISPNRHPYHFNPVQPLLERDRQPRSEFCEWLINKVDDEPRFLRKILWTDEATFTRKYIAVGEKGELPTLSIYEVSSLRRIKLLGIPVKESTANDWASVAFLQDNHQLVGVTSEPDWTLLLYDWRRGKVLYTGQASQRGLPVVQVVPNPDDGTVLAVIGDGLFRLLSQSDSSWRQYGFSRADKVPLEVAAWIGPQQLLAGSRDGRFLLVDYGELRAVYFAYNLTEISLTESGVKSRDAVSLASQVVPAEDRLGLHRVRALVAFQKGFLYSCNVGEIWVFQRTQQLRWIKKYVIKIPSLLREEEYRSLYNIQFASVTPSLSKVIVTIRKPELYMCSLLWEQESKGVEELEFELDGTGYHDGRIVALSTCLWKPIFLTAGAHDKTIRIWNYQTLNVTIIKRFSDEIYSAALHPSGFFCLMGFTDKLRFMLILVNDLKTIRHVDIRGCRNVRFGGGGHIFAATRDQVIEVYSAITFTRIHTLHAHLGPVTRLIFGPYDKCLWSCGAEGSLYEWDMESGRRLTDIFTNKNGQLGLAINEAVYTVGTDGNLKEIIQGEISREIEMQQSSLTCVTLGNSGQMLFLGGERSCVVSLIYPLVHPPKWAEFLIHSQPLSDIAISADDSRLMTTSDEGFLCVWRVVRPPDGGEPEPEGGEVTEVLLELEELESLRSGIRELGDRLEETEGEHEYELRQITAANQTNIRETNSTYTNILEDLKFRIKQMDREHLVEINKFQNKLKEEKGSHGNEMDQLEKRYSEKLLAELNRIEELQNLLKKSKEDNERLKLEIGEQYKAALAKVEEEKQRKIFEKDKRINELEITLKTIEKDQESSKVLLEEEFHKKKEDVGKSFVTKILEKEMIIGKLKNENGIFIKTHILIRKENDELKSKIKLLQEEICKKDETLEYSTKEAEVLKSQLNEKDWLIGKEGRAIVKLTKENDLLKKEIHFRDTTAEALLEKIQPKDTALRLTENKLHEKTKETEELSMLVSKASIEVGHLKKKILMNEKEIRKQKLQFGQIKILLRRISLEIQIAMSNLYQPKLLKETVIKMSEKFNKSNKYEVDEDYKTYQEILLRQHRMEKTISSLRNKLKMQSKDYTVVERPHKIAFKLLTEFNHLTLKLRENRRKVQYLQTLLGLSLRKK